MLLVTQIGEPSCFVIGFYPERSSEVGLLTEEICEYEQRGIGCAFQAGPIRITRASYGRMRLGRCVRGDIGYVGCSTDVTEIIAERCDGRQSCFVEIPDEELSQLQPCPEDLSSYLEIEYQCISTSAGKLPPQTA